MGRMSVRGSLRCRGWRVALRVVVFGTLVAGALDAGIAVAGMSGAVMEATAAVPHGLVVGRPFALLGGGLEKVALGADGMAWVAVASDEEESESFAVDGRAASGHGIRPVNVANAALPSVAVSGSTAMFVWYTVPVGELRPGHPQPQMLDAMRCTSSGCGPVRTLARWEEVDVPPLQDNFSVGYPAQPAVVGVDGQFVVLFEPESAQEMMDWVQSDGSTFGSVHSFGMAGEPYPVAAAQSDGSVIAAWPGPFKSPGIEWSRWSAGAGFSTPQRLGGTTDYAADLVAAGDGSGVALAWLQGSNCGGAPGLLTCPVWAALPGAGGGLGPASRVDSPAAGQLSLAGGDGVFALAFARATISGYADDAQGTYLERSINGQPFNRPVDLDADTGSSPAVTFDGHGDALVVWRHEPPPPNSGNSTVRLALIARTGDAFTPITLGGDAYDDSPLIASTPNQTLITWQSPGGTGVLATP
jgi:hypothetical protein